tara:strand:- start:717 stop:1220 length:504 start_codon:yes stop_codon:yes gene_type:complete
MKITKARLKELIKEELQSEVIGLAFAAKAKKKKEEKKDSDKEKLQKEGGYRGEGAMADSQLNRIADLAVMIDDLVSDESNLPEWVESKITKAQDYMSAVLNYMKGEIADAQEEMMREEEERKTTPAQRERIKDRAEEIKPSTIKQYGKKEGTSAAFGIATDQVLGET